MRFSCSHPYPFYLGGIRDVSKSLFQLWLSVLQQRLFEFTWVPVQCLSSEVCGWLGGVTGIIGMFSSLAVLSGACVELV